MGAFSPFKRFFVEDFPDQKAWFGKLAQPLNDFLETVSGILKNNVSFKENIAAQVNTLTVTEIPFEFAWNRKDRPIGVIVLAARDGASAAVGGISLPAWEYTSAGKVKLNTLPTLSPTPSAANPYTITLVTIGG